MQSNSAYSGFQELHAQGTNQYVGFEQLRKECNDEIRNVNSAGQLQSNSSLSGHIDSSTNFKTTPSASYLLSHRLCTPLISAVYTEIVTIWFHEKWLIFTDNHKETFLILNPNITGCLTIQMAIDKKYFINDGLPLRSLPECLLIRTETNNQVLVLPNSTISLEKLLSRQQRSAARVSQGKLIAILCESRENNIKLMFYKHSRRNQWYIYFNDLATPFEFHSNILSNEEQFQLESISEQNQQTNFNTLSQLPFPLSALCSHPITYVYIVEKRHDDN